jgi:hypothetical protein
MELICSGMTLVNRLLKRWSPRRSYSDSREHLERYVVRSLACLVTELGLKSGAGFRSEGGR